MENIDTTASIPDLRIVEVKDLIPHELEDIQRAEPLIKRLPQDGTLRNPPIVTPLTNSGRFVILDGTNRVMALDALHYNVTLVQVVRYELPDVELHTWNHIITGLGSSQILARLQEVSNLDIVFTDPLHARASLARRTSLAYCVLDDGRAAMLSGGGWDLHERTHVLQSIVTSYLEGSHLHRTNLHDLAQLKSLYPELGAAVIFPRYEPEEVLDLAEAGLPVPPGITRHVIHGRALHVNYPLDQLASDQSIEHKNKALSEWTVNLFAHKRVRYYAESTYMFDE